MTAGHTSYELLAHFDGPQHADAIEQESGPPAPSQSATPQTIRGVGWVLKWAAAIAVLVFAAGVLIEFALTVAAKDVMIRAARAGTLEATLPRATNKSVSDAVARRLVSYPSLASRLQLNIEQNDIPVRGTFQPQDGDRITITLTADSSEVLPTWLQRLRIRESDPTLEVSAERSIPGKQLMARQH